LGQLGVTQVDKVKINFWNFQYWENIETRNKCRKSTFSKEFKELSFIAIGSYGIVCKAINKKTNELFAIKKIPIEKRFEEKALKEIEILPKLKSEFIVRLESVWIEVISMSQILNYLKIRAQSRASNT
jgi:serine/threonine protein kinase